MKLKLPTYLATANLAVLLFTASCTKLDLAEEKDRITFKSGSALEVEDEWHFGFGSGVYMATPYNPDISGMQFADQMQLIKDSGGDTYRTSFTADANGVLPTYRLDLMTRLSNAAQSAGVQLMPVVIDRMYSFWNSTEQEAYDGGYNYMYNFVTNYGHLYPWKLYELSNEISLFRDLKKDLDDIDSDGNTSESLGTGTARSHYNSRFENAVAYMAGMADGCKAAEPGARTIFNTAGWAPTYLMEQVLASTNNVDIVGWHWYSDMQWNWHNYPGDTTNAANIIELLWNRYQKPIWITEANARWNRYPEGEREQKQLDFHQEFYSICRSHPAVIGYSIHAMLVVPGLYGDSYGIFSYSSGSTYPSNITPRKLGQYLLDYGPDGPDLTLVPTRDAFVRAGIYAGNNYGDLADLEVKQSTNPDFFRKTYLKFDFTGSGVSSVQSAKLRLFCRTRDGNSTITAYATSDNWGDSTITWTNAPSMGNSITSTNVSDEGVFYEWDVTNYVNFGLSTGSFVSFVLHDAGASNVLTRFNSKEAAANKPALVIEM